MTSQVTPHLGKLDSYETQTEAMLLLIAFMIEFVLQVTC